MNSKTFHGQDGTSRAYYCWKPKGPSKGDIVLCHGYAEHAGRYAEPASRLNDGGYTVWALDHYGHGKSEGKRADVKDFRLFAEDVHIFINTIVLPAASKDTNKNERNPLFLYGHSMGGAIALLYTIDHQSVLKGLILSGPMVRPGGVSTPLERNIAHILRKILPGLPFRPFPADYLSHDKKVVQAYKNDPLNYIGKMKIRLADEFLHMEKYLSDDALARIELPVLLLHGGDDITVPPSNSQVIFNNISSKDKTRKVFPGLYHEIHKEDERESVFSTICEWIKDRS